MDKRYQVFVSSTYADLQEERRRIIQALMEMDCIPAGMELFPAADDEQWQFIKRIIDDCDYYILVIGGRYGSLSSEGISYTEKEFDYALARGLKVLAFVHASPDELSVAKSDIDPALRTKLAEFRARVCSDRLVKFWHEATELPGLVALSLQKTIKIYPALGWVRGGGASNPELLAELNTVRKQNEVLQLKISQLEATGAAPALADLAGLDESFIAGINWKRNGIICREKVAQTWAQIFSSIAPSLQEHPTDQTVCWNLGKVLFKKRKNAEPSVLVQVDDEDFETIRMQLSALGLIVTTYTQTVQGGMAFFWNLTPHGENTMLRMRTIKKNSAQVPKKFHHEGE